MGGSSESFGEGAVTETRNAKTLGPGTEPPRRFGTRHEMDFELSRIHSPGRPTAVLGRLRGWGGSQVRPIAFQGPVGHMRWYDVMRIMLTWAVWRRPAAERTPLLSAAQASQNDAGL